jgi:hypothetical protein
VPKRTFQDPDLGKFTRDAPLDAWVGKFKPDVGNAVALEIRGDDEPPAPDELPALLPRLKRLLDRLRKQGDSWRERAAAEVQGELEEQFAERGYDLDADVEPITDGPVLHSVDVWVGPRGKLSARVRYELSFLAGGSWTADWWVIVEINSRGQYGGATLDRV